MGKKNRKIKIIIISIFLFLIISLIASIFIYLYFKNDISNYIERAYSKIENMDRNSFNNRKTTKIYDNNGKVLKEFKVREYDYQKYKDINPYLFKAFIAVEDKRFYEHNGIDFKALVRAGIVILKGGELQGGSTITQQLAKNIFLTMDRNIWRKLEEAVIAQEIEKKFSKKDILEFYVNNINFGHGCYSVETASMYYFGKNTKDLTLSQIALLAGIPNNPSVYDPIANKENAIKRRNSIINKMYSSKFITEKEQISAKKEALELNIQKKYYDNNINDYAIEYAIQKSTEEMMKDDGFQFRYIYNNEEQRKKYLNLYSEEYKKCREEVINGGYEINTCINSDLQNKLQSIIDKEMSKYKKINKSNNLYMKQSASTVINNDTGEVIAIVGGRSQDGKLNSFNRASIGARQPGSTMKPLISYLPAFEKGYSPDDQFTDKPINKGPLNWYKGYKGDITLRYATEISTNTIPFRLTKLNGAEKSLKYLAKMNFKYLTPADKTPTIALGGLTRGATTTEMASAYSTIARNGEFIEPTNIKEIKKITTGEVIYKNNKNKKRVYDSGASYLMTDVLKGSIEKEHGTSHKAKLNNYKYQAGKTGTTNNNKDAWFCGYTPYFTMSVWIGDDIPSNQSSLESNSVKSIWNKFMSGLHEGKEERDFKKPEQVYIENGRLKTLGPKEFAIKKERLRFEKDRKDNESKTQKDRLKELEYRVIFGLSEDEELIREIKAKNEIESLREYKLINLTQVKELDRILLQVKNSVMNVKRKSVYDELMEKYRFLNNNFNDIKAQLNREKREEEYLKKQQEREEREYQEKIKNQNNNNIQENEEKETTTKDENLNNESDNENNDTEDSPEDKENNNNNENNDIETNDNKNEI
ncbi:transglycosylase domain-containing protein [Clostridioides difficile]|nr:transglycosylase domain-containing protein [Clostridioides difficile]